MLERGLSGFELLLNTAQLALHRFRECTLLMPTWFMARATFDFLEQELDPVTGRLSQRQFDRLAEVVVLEAAQ